MLKHKFRAKPTTFQGRKYASKLEASYAQTLEMNKKGGHLLFYLEQVPFSLPGGITYRADFMEFWSNGEVVVTEVKGFETPEWKMKHKLFEETYPITIHVVKRV